MPAPEIAELIERSAADGLVLRRVRMPSAQAIFFKCVLESYSGLALVYADRRVPGERQPELHVTVVTTPGFAAELDAVMAELRSSLDLEIEAA
jgi:hypothetical protein